MNRANPTPRQLKVLGAPSAAANQDRRRIRDRRSESDPSDDLVSLGSHELRNAVASIVGCAELIDSGDLADDGLHLYTGILLREGRRLSAVINNAETLRRLEHGQREFDLAPVDLGSLIQRAVLAAGEDDQRQIDIQVPAQLPLVSAEAEAILEVLANFLSNARRFSPDGGSIGIAARQVGDMVEVDIWDHGIGIEAEALPKLFRKFYSADSGVGRLAPGAGLGLAINHRIIEAHGGTVVASSKGAGKGARFQFTLPISRPSATSGKVLIIEDHAGFASLLKAEFAAEGISTVRAADAETAERILADATPLAIILDLALPGLQGEDFLARMWAGGGTRLPVVVLTMKNLGPDEISALLTTGAAAVLPKEAGAPQAAVALIAKALSLDPVAGMRSRAPTALETLRTVLIADDESSIRLLVHATIESDDYVVVEAADGAQAWALIQKVKPSVVLLDVQMPGRSGLEVLRSIKSDPNLARTRVILLTSKAQEGDVEAGLMAGADFYLTKPFSPLDLLTRVDEALQL